MTLFGAACATDPSEGDAIALERGASTLDPPRAGDTAPPAVNRAPAALAASGQVGFYDMTLGAGQSYQVPPISAASGTAVFIDDPSAAQLAGLNVLWVHNEDNGGFGAEYAARLADIDAAVQAGMVLVIHDRTVDGAAGILPGGGGFTILRDFSDAANIDLRDASTQVTAGLTNGSLDGGSSSSHGFALDSSLPARAKLFLTTGTPSHVVTFCYPRGRGAVIYSTIPLDFYLQGIGPVDLQFAMANVYAPDVVKYAIAGACKTRGPTPTPN